MTVLTPDPSLRVTRRWTLLALAAGGVTQLGACGGGGTDFAGLSSGGTGSFTGGTVGGLGSIIVNGIRFDDSSATVVRTDGEPTSTLKVGMVVSVQAGEVRPARDGAGSATATAVKITYRSEWLGPVDAVGAGEITVLGQVVEVSDSTVFDGGSAVQRWTDLTQQHIVEVFGYLDSASARLQATRIEVRDATDHYKLSGALLSHDAPGRSLTVGGAAVGYGAGVRVPPGLRRAQVVSLRLSPVRGGGRLEAARVEARPSAASGLQLEDGSVASLRGAVTGMRTSTDFEVEGVTVQVAAGVSVPAGLAVGSLVGVQGRMEGGRLVAQEVTVVDGAPAEAETFVFHGRVATLVVDAAGSTFRLRGLPFVTTSQTTIRVPGWQTGAKPSVKVTAIQADGQWKAVSIDPD